jgi:Domain of unknown function (DUF4145)
MGFARLAAGGEAGGGGVRAQNSVRRDFAEARLIFLQSPRGAAALLRLAVQKLCAVLGELGKNINDDIASLVRKGLSVQVQQALDTVRVVGNDAVHLGQIDLNDDPTTAASLFELINMIVDEMISNRRKLKKCTTSCQQINEMLFRSAAARQAIKLNALNVLCSEFLPRPLPLRCDPSRHFLIEHLHRQRLTKQIRKRNASLLDGMR